MCEFLAVLFPRATLLLKSMVFQIPIIKQRFGFKTLGRFSTHNPFLKVQIFTINSCFYFLCQNTLGKLWLCWPCRKKVLFVPECLEHPLLLHCYGSRLPHLSSGQSQISSDSYPIPPSPWVQIADGDDGSYCRIWGRGNNMVRAS